MQYSYQHVSSLSNSIGWGNGRSNRLYVVQCLVRLWLFLASSLVKTCLHELHKVVWSLTSSKIGYPFTIFHHALARNRLTCKELSRVLGLQWQSWALRTSKDVGLISPLSLLSPSWDQRPLHISPTIFEEAGLAMNPSVVSLTRLWTVLLGS
jgi:hypothetical protein